MKIKLKRTELRRALSTIGWAGAHIPNNSSEWLCLTTGIGYLTLEHNMQEAAFQTQVPAECTCGIKVLLPKRLRHIVSRIKTDNVLMEFSEGTVTLSGGNAKFTIKTKTAAEYPQYSDYEIDDSGIEIAPELFRKAIRATTFAARKSTNTSSVLQCVSISIQEKQIVFLAADGARIARFTIDLETQTQYRQASFLLRPHLLERLRRSSTKTPVRIAIKPNNHLVFALSEKTRAAVPTEQGTYPTLDKVITSTNQDHEQALSMTMRRTDFDSILSQTAVVASHEHRVLHLHTNDNCLYAEIQTPEIGYASSSLKLNTMNRKVSVTVDVVLLKEALSALRWQEHICLSMIDNSNPLKISTGHWEFFLMTFADNTQQRHSYTDSLGFYQPPIQSLAKRN